ncbi:hypothetical protein QAD02_023721 [Eretmocerus hayati]|uniref:Uncharacterized protein n=1 Tax=Eretmocerus hayati TaxID=131215 RepID=A0ACC2PYU7_9HYME|nr:hypothetical protein QAD02_023721 [Eretmocerus hayati]
MSRIPLLLGGLASLALAIFLVYRRTDKQPTRTTPKGSLDRDLRDLLSIIPIRELRAVIRECAKSDKQIADTIAFFTDQCRFIIPELSRITHVRLFIFILEELGLDIDSWLYTIQNFWKSLPKYEGDHNCCVATGCGGLTGMISRMVRLLPRAELHTMMCKKARGESKSFETLMLALRSQEFHDLCNEVQKSVVLQRHFHWARESGIEATFALELLGDLYAYLTLEVARS